MKTGEGIILIILFLLLGSSIYLLYLNWPTKPIELVKKNGGDLNTINNSRFADSPNTSKQFYPNLRFPDKEISYWPQEDCSEEDKLRLEKAFDILESKTILDFTKTNANAQITITCSEINTEPNTEGHFIAGEGGPTQIINTSLYAVALSGKISLYRPETCDEPNIAIHELLHVLGFDHNSNPKSILYPTLNCDQKIDNYILEEIDRLYSIPGRADLIISDIKATKTGRYLGFEIKVENQGLKNAENVDLHIYADGKIANNFELGKIDIGTTKILSVENMKISRSAEEIEFVIDNENKIQEIFEDNNRVRLVLSE